MADTFSKEAAKKQVGTIYLIHFDKTIGNKSNPLAQASHYTGWTSDLSSRLNRHALGQGSSIISYLVQSGIGYKVVRTWLGTRDQERLMKNQKNSKRYCPLCTHPPLNPAFLPEETYQKRFPAIMASMNYWLL